MSGTALARTPIHVRRGALLGSTAMYVCAVAVQALGPVMALPILAHHLAGGSFGELTVVIAMGAIAAPLLDAGCSACITRDLLVGDEHRDSAWSLAATGSLATVTISVGLVAVAAVVGSSILPDQAAAMAVPAVLVGVGAALTAQAQAIHRADGEAGKYLRAAAVAVALAFAPAVLLATLGGDAREVAFAVGSGGAVAGCASLLAAAGSRWRRPTRRAGRRLVAIGLPLLPHTAAAQLITNLPRLVVGAQLGMTAVGAYQLVCLAGSGPSLVLGAVNNVWAVQVYGSSSAARADIANRLSRLVMASALGLVGLAVLVGSVGFRLVAAAPQRDLFDANALLLLALAAVPIAVYLSAHHFLIVASATGVLTVAAPTAAVAAGVLALAAVPRVGLLGAAAATLVAQGWLAVLVWATARRIDSDTPRVDRRLGGLAIMVALVPLLQRSPVTLLAAGLLVIVAVAETRHRWSSTW